MSCDGNVCGTGTWTGPKPGDPDNNVSLHANQVYGGITVSWSFPLVNSNAVAHTMLYRGTLNDFTKAVKLGYVGGSIYHDQLNPAADTTYFYWIQIVSVNATVGDPVGPASAIARPQAQQTLESLSGLIDAGQLAHDLKTSIAGLTTTNTALYQEIQDRLMANTQLAAALAQINDGLAEAVAFVNEETTARTDGDSAIVTQVEILAAANQGALAAIDQERQVRVGKDDALASRIDAMLVTVGQNSAAIQDEQTVRAGADNALATAIQNVATSAGNALAAVQDETTARSNADSALASRITTTEASLNGNTASGQLGLITQVSQVNGLVSSLSAEYFAKVEVNGLVGGFGLYNNGALVEAGFDVDRFWVGRTGPDKVKPFIIDNGIVYIDKARIRNADIDTLKIAGSSIMVGTYTEGGIRTVNGSTTLLTRTLGLGDSNNSGLIVSATVAVSGSDSVTVGFRVYINGVIVGDQRASIQGGYGFIFPVSGFGYSTTGTATVVLEGYAPSGGTFTVGASTMAIMGGKR